MKETSTEGHISIGQVLKPQGLKGIVKVRPDTDDPGRFFLLRSVLVPDSHGAMKEIAVRDVSVSHGFVYLRMGGDSSASAAETRRGVQLYVSRADAVPLGEGENFIADMAGCEVCDTEGLRIGILDDILQPGGNDVYVVKTPSGTLLIPALRHVVLSVDTLNKQIIVHPERVKEVSVFED